MVNFPTIDGEYSNISTNHGNISSNNSVNSSFQIDWMGKQKQFQLAFGGDRVTIGTVDGATSMLVTDLNAGQRIHSRHHNHPVCAAGKRKVSHPEIQ